MLRLSSIVLALLLAMPALGISSTKFPASVVNTDVGDSNAWTNPGDAATSNDTRASRAATGANDSDALDATDFSFAVPGGAVITGITCITEARRDDSKSGWIEDVFIIKGGSAQAQDNADTTPTPVGSDTSVEHPSGGTLWGVGWTAADINASNFGCRVIAHIESGAPATNMLVDSISIKVDYSLSGGAAIWF